MTDFNYSFELHDLYDPVTSYGVIETRPPVVSSILSDDFRLGDHFRTGPDENNSLQLVLEDRLLTMILDMSGSMTWNDYSGDRFEYCRRLLTKLNNTYPANISMNLLTFGGALTKTTLLVLPFSTESSNVNYNQVLQDSFEDSAYDFAGVRVVRRNFIDANHPDGFPSNPNDGFIVAEGIIEAVRDDDLDSDVTYYYGIWSFNKNGTFGDGQFIKVTPRERILPNGINFAYGLTRILPGVERDDNTILIYSFLEKSGSLTFDSSGNEKHGVIGTQTVLNNFWSGDSSYSSHISGSLKHPVGVKFDGEFDIIESAIDSDFNYNNTSSLTINFWMFRYVNSAEQWIIGTSDQIDLNDIGWAIGVNTSGNICVGLDDISLGFNVASSSFTVPTREWTMITVILPDANGDIVMYKNGVRDSVLTSAPVGTYGADYLYIGAKTTDSTFNWPGEDFFGSLNQISIHNIERQSDYISELYNDELLIFNQTSLSVNQNPPDNRQREVLLQWSIADTFNYSGGSVKIVRKFQTIPDHIDDGVTIVDQSASPGEFFYLDTFGFTNNSDYHYRVFTINSLGNSCDRSDARIISVHIPKSNNANYGFYLNPVYDVSLTAGDKKILLEWTDSVVDEYGVGDWRGTKVYGSTVRYPVIEINSQGTLTITDGIELIDTTDAYFIHRTNGQNNGGSDIPLVNGQIYYYTIISYDRFGNLSSPVTISGIPSVDGESSFIPANVYDLHSTVLNSESISLQWTNPILRSDQLNLFFGDSALIFASLKEYFGGNLDGVVDLHVEYCTQVFEITTSNGQPLGIGSGDSDEPVCGSQSVSVEGCYSGSTFDPNCNTDQAIAETVLRYSTIQSGLVKGIITHTQNRSILSQRKKYIMDVRALYKIDDPNTGTNLFNFYTKSIRVKFENPIKSAAVNKLNKSIFVGCENSGGMRGNSACPCSESNSNPNPCVRKEYNGQYVGASQPYICRLEFQWKHGAFPDGTIVDVELFKHGSTTEKSTKTIIREGAYLTTPVFVPEIGENGSETGQLIAKSIVDVPINSPESPDFVDLIATIEHDGFSSQLKHEVRFIGSLFIVADINYPSPNGIDLAEQFATVYTLDPDDPDDLTKKRPVPDGTVVKWELIKLQFGKDRPLFSTQSSSQLVSGVYSSTSSGVARGVFFGPVGNVQPHYVNCGEEEDPCCVGEEYAIKASVIYNDISVSDAMRFNYVCPDTENYNVNYLFLVDADHEQPYAGAPQSNPHWITWADGSHLLKFQIAKNAVDAADQNYSGFMPSAPCFGNCVGTSEAYTNINFNVGDIVTINAPGEILWDVTFEQDEYTGEFIPVTYQSESPIQTDGAGILASARIPITGAITNFYVRLNAFVGNRNPQPVDCDLFGGSGTGGGNELLPCEWENKCIDAIGCVPTRGIRWSNVNIITGSCTKIYNNKEITAFAGGSYENGVPPIYIGFIEPLVVKVVDARINGARVHELVVDGVSRHSFVVEVTFAGLPVPDGTPVQISITGQNQDIILLSNCTDVEGSCYSSSSGVVYTRQVNDLLLNPQNDEGTVSTRSLAYFSIEPLPNIAFNSQINVTSTYDELGTVERLVTSCVNLINTVNITQPTNPPDDEPDPVPSATSNETIIYNTVQDIYETSKTNLVRRTGHFDASVLSGSSDIIYLFGGYTGSGESATSNITPLCEFFNVANQVWEFTTDMPTARAFGMTVVNGYDIYCIGGVSLTSLSQYSVSRKVEVFNTLNESWETKSSMPENYGVAYGNAQIIGSYIYVTCGVTSIINNSQPGDLNTKLLRYSIANDEWETFSVSDENLYSRIGHFGFYRSSDNYYYICGGSVPKSRSVIEAERNELINRKLNDFRSYILSSAYFLNLSVSDQQAFIEREEEKIISTTTVPAFIYPFTGFRFAIGSENEANLTIDISDTIDQYWRVLPLSRDMGRCVYIEDQDIAYFMGGSNQNQSTTLNRVEMIDFSNNNRYSQLTSFSRGRAMFTATNVGNDIYLTGGLTSGHKDGYISIEVSQLPSNVEARGLESAGILLTLKNDSGEVINDDIRVAVRGRLRMDAIDSILVKFFAQRAADRVLSESSSTDINEIIKAQNSSINPNSDEFQFNAARKLGEEVYLFPILYSQNEFTINNGVGGITLLPRSEDPLHNFTQLAEFINNILENTPESETVGGLSRDELAALGDSLSVVNIPPTTIESGLLRNLYQIETTFTILDDFYFGQTVSDLDLNIQQEIKDRITDLLNEGSSSGSGSGSSSNDSLGGLGLGSGSSKANTNCFVLQHLAQPDVPPPSTPPGSGQNNPVGTGGISQSGQCLFCQTILPTNVTVRDQLPTVITQYYNVIDWVPQIKEIFNTNDSSIQDSLDKINILKQDIPFGSSQLYDSLFNTSRIISDENFDNLKKMIYICSDNSENLSSITRDQVIEEINAVDGDRNVPIIYVTLSTSFPASLATQLERTQVGSIEKLTYFTGGQSSTLTSSTFLNQILNQTIGSATGGLGYGIYSKTFDFGSVLGFVSIVLNFELPSNTQGFVRLKHSTNGYDFSDFSERFEGNQTVDFSDFIARYITVEVILTTGFTTDVTEDYDGSSTGIPKLISITWNASAERIDYIFINKETIETNAQQVAAAFDGDVPVVGEVEIGVAASNSSDWRDYVSVARPSIKDGGKTLLLDRTRDATGSVRAEVLTTRNGLLYASEYGSFDPSATIELFEVIYDENGDEVRENAITSGYRLSPRNGEVYFDTKQSLDKVIRLYITNSNLVKVGLMIKNKFYTDSVTIRGVGFIYSTNNQRQAALSQVPPRALNVYVQPTNPSVIDSISVSYIYQDLNRNKESGTNISWFQNGFKLLELQNKTVWSYEDLRLSHELSPGDKIYCTVTPKDGLDFGTPVNSNVVTLLASAPTATSASVVATRDNLVNPRYDTSSNFSASYNYVAQNDDDLYKEEGTTIRWFVNGNLFKEGSFSSFIQYSVLDNPKIISVGETRNGAIAHVIGNQIYSEITPRTRSGVAGSTVTTPTVIVVNSIPKVSNVRITPAVPTIQTTLQVSYTISDQDLIGSDQTDQSLIKWYKSTDGINFSSITSLDGLSRVLPENLASGQKWYAEITPYDGIDKGAIAKSQIVLISLP